MLISSDLNRLSPPRARGGLSLAERKEGPSAPVRPAENPTQNPAEGKTGQGPFSARPVLEPEQTDRFSRGDARSPDLAVEADDPRARLAINAYYEVSTYQEREYVRSMFGVDIYA